MEKNSLEPEKNDSNERMGHQYAIINDAVHGVMSFPDKYKDLIKSLIDSESFQRLRHIKQLGMTDLIFPTAIHNRFSHCLGAAYLACMMSDKLDLNPDRKKYALVGALLHDIGHGPFSHAFEKFLKNKKDEKVIKHEDWTDLFLMEFDQVLRHHGIDYRIISDLIQHKYDLSLKTYNIPADIISSQLDADRLDYLLRDSHFCGVPYGNPDIKWIISHLAEINETDQPPRLGFLSKGWRAVEHFLLCRRIITQNVYNHHRKNIFENLLILFLIEVSKDEKLHKKINNYNLKIFLENSNKYRNDEIKKDDFIRKNYSYYKTLTDYDIWMLIRDFSSEQDNFKNAFKIARLIYRREAHKSFRFEETCLDAVESMVEEYKNKYEIPDWKIFVNPSSIMSYKAQDDPILVLNNDNTVYSIQKYSNLLNILGDKHEKEGYLYPFQMKGLDLC